MRDSKYIWLVGLGITLLIIGVPIYLFTFDPPVVSADPWASVPDRSRDPVDHSHFFTGTYETGSDITRVCLTCHEDAGDQMLHTSHFRWLSEPQIVEGRDEPIEIGKANLVNNFCLSAAANLDSCTRCHTGYGWVDDTYDFTNPENVDCLVCHDNSGTYVRAAGGQVAEGVDLVLVAQSVGTPTRQNCGGCHFDGGGGNGVKHGDLDESLYYPPESVDVHMGRYDFLCIDCHQTEDHQIGGQAISVNTNVEDHNIACTDCHEPTLHEDERITEHLDTVACQTCHVTVTALRDPTKISWDWSQAGDATRVESVHEYLRIKGEFVYENDYIPQIAWFNGNIARYLVGDLIDPTVSTVLNQPLGDIADIDSLLYPFKIHYGNQPYDTVNNILLTPRTVGEDGYWTTFDWDSSLQLGADLAGISYSGEFGFAPTEMYWMQTHMVRPAENALTCTSCHGEGGRIDWLALGYPGDPMVWGGRTP